MTDAIYNPKELGDVLDRALDCCFERIFVRDEGPIAFRVILNTEGEISDQRIGFELAGDWIEPMTDLLDHKKAEIKIYALVCAGTLVWKGKDRPAIMIEVAEQGNDESIMLAQRYAVVQRKRKAIKMKGKISLVGLRDSPIYPAGVGGNVGNCLIN